MRAVGHAGNESTTGTPTSLAGTHQAAAEQTAALVRQAGGRS